MTRSVSALSGRGCRQGVDVASAEDRIPVVTFPLSLVEHLHAHVRGPDPDPSQRILADRRAVVRIRESRLLPHILPLRLLSLPAQAVDAARFRRDPQVFRARQAGSRQELRRHRRKLLRQSRLNANAQEKNKDGKDFRHCRYNGLKKELFRVNIQIILLLVDI